MFVDAIYTRKTDTINVVERVDGKRKYRQFPASYVFYYEDPRGRYKSMWGKPCNKYQTTSHGKFQNELRAHSHKNIHEDGVNPIFRCLYDNYRSADAPEFNLGFFDIETDFDPERGFAPTTDPFSRITAVSVYLTSISKLITFVLKPDVPKTDPHYLTFEKAQEICDEFEDTILCETEEDLLKYFLDIIEDVDVLSGWNSTGYDIPYIVNRIDRVLGKEYTKKMCLWNMSPKKRKYIKFGKEQETYDLVGRVHMDYLELYQKHNPQKLHTYKLDYIGEILVKENKIPYEGTLDQLYKQDFKKFIAYNRQDTMLLHKIDLKCRFIELHNQLSHANCVPLQTTMGSVAMIDQAITNAVWEQGMQVPRRKNRFEIQQEENEDDEDEDEIEDGAVGAYVADPKAGFHKMIGCTDINSLYPSVLRALNMGPETIVAQIRPDYTDAFINGRIKNGASVVEAWHEVFAALEYDFVAGQTDDEITVDYEDGQTLRMTGADFHREIFREGSQYILSANGTLFRKDKKSIIAQLLETWYSERTIMRKKSAEYTNMYQGVEIDNELSELLGTEFNEV